METPLTFAPARPEDAPRAREILFAAFAAYVARLGRAFRPGAYQNLEEEIAAGKVLIAWRGERMVGAAILQKSADAWELDQLAVDPAEQGGGVGAALMAHIEAEARAAGVRRVTLFTAEIMDHLLRFYGRLGYLETRRAPSPKGDDGVIRVFMEKRLLD